MLGTALLYELHGESLLRTYQLASVGRWVGIREILKKLIWFIKLASEDSSQYTRKSTGIIWGYIQTKLDKF